MAVNPIPNQTVTGVVASVNPKGLKLDGRPDWLNFSRFAQDIVPPMRGQTVTLTLDRQGFVRAVHPADGSEVTPSTNGSVRPAQGHTAPDPRELRIIRQSVLKTAGEFCASRPDLRSLDLLALAERLEAWVLRPYEGPELTDAF